jgi:putative ABC transport system permease protein
MILRLALKEILYHKRFSLLFIVNISLGLLGLVLVENFKYSFQDTLAAKSKLLLGADLAVRSRYLLSDEKKEGFYDLIKSNSVTGRYESSVLISLFSMLKINNNEPRLVALNSLDGKFPFYGNLKLYGDNKLYPKTLREPEPGHIWLYKDALGRLNRGQVSKLEVGGETLVLDDLVEQDDQQAFSTAVLAPKVFVSIETLKASSLIQKGSTVTYSYYIKAPLVLTDDFIKKLNDYFNDNSIKVVTPEKTSMQVGRIFSYLSDFLGLVSIISLLLASLGLFYLFRSSISEKKSVFAILNSIGLSLVTIRKTYWLYSFILIIIATIVALISAQLLVPLMSIVIEQLLGVKLSYLLHGKAIFVTSVVGVVGTFFLILPILKLVLSQKISSLFQEVSPESKSDRRKVITLFFPYIIFFIAVTIYLANSYKVAFVFLIALSSVVLILYPLGSFLLESLYKRSHNFNLYTKLSVRYLRRFKVATLSIFICLTMCSVLLNILPQIEQSLRKELSFSDTNKKPQLFLFDIQDEQVAPLKSFLRENQYKLIALSPMIRARLLKINEVDVAVTSDKALTREEQREQRFRNRGVNLGYRRKIIDSEKIVKGVMPDSDFIDDGHNIAAVSLEVRYAKRLDVHLGDHLTFDILGVEQEAIVTSIRSVKWTSFVPNFLIQFQAGVLENAPKTWLAAINPLDQNIKNTLRLDLFEAFPNVSVVNIEEVINKILSIMKQMTFALMAMSFLSLIVGLMVLYSLVGHQLQQRKKDLVLLNIIGIKKHGLLSMIKKEFLSLVFIASVIGGVLGIIVSYLLSYLFFDANWAGSLMVPVYLGLCCLTLSYLIVRFSSRDLLTR